MERKIEGKRKLARTQLSSIEECLLDSQLVVLKTYDRFFLKQLLSDYSEDDEGLPIFSSGRRFFDRERTTYERLSSNPSLAEYYPIYYGHISDQKKNEILIIERACGPLMNWNSSENQFCFYSKDFEGRCSETAFVTRTLKHMIECLMHLHHLHLAHLDIKPDNFLIFGDQVKLADFNTSRDIRRGQKMKKSYGNLLFAAPETLNCDQEGYDPFKADVWALGALFFIFLTGKMLFGNLENNNCEHSTSIYERKILEHQIDFESVQKEHRYLLTKMLERKPENRLSCQELLTYEVFNCN